MPRIDIRCSVNEKADLKIRADAAGVTVSELVRQSLGRVRTWTASHRQAHRERTLELARIGTNLNQIARWCNTYKTTAEATEVLAALVAVERQLKDLRKC